MVHCYSTGDGNVSFHKGTLAPPGEYDWTCASFGPLESTTDTANGSVQSFLHSLWQKVYIILYNGRSYQPELPLPMGVIWTSHVTHDAFGLNKSTTQTAPGLVQPSLHRWPLSVSILYNGLPAFHQNCPFPCWHIWTWFNTWFIGPSQVRNANGNLIISAVFAGPTDWQSDRKIDRPRYSVRCGIIRRNYVEYSKVAII